MLQSWRIGKGIGVPLIFVSPLNASIIPSSASFVSWSWSGDMYPSDSRWASRLAIHLTQTTAAFLRPCSRLSSGCVRYCSRRELLSDLPCTWSIIV